MVHQKEIKQTQREKKQLPQKVDEPERVWKAITERVWKAKRRKTEMEDTKYSLFKIGQTMSRKGT